MSDDETRERPASTSRAISPSQGVEERARAAEGREPTIPGALQPGDVEVAEKAAEKPKPKRAPVKK